MNKELKKRINNFLDNYQEIQSAYYGLEKLNSLVCAYIFTEKSQKVNKYGLKDAHEDIDGLSNAFKHDLKPFLPVMASVMGACSNETSKKEIEEFKTLYKEIEEHFTDSEYLPVAACFLSYYKDIKKVDFLHADELYAKLLQEQLWNTHEEDVPVTILAAYEFVNILTYYDNFITCKKLLSKSIRKNNKLQSVCELIAMDGAKNPKVDCEAVVYLDKALRKAGLSFYNDNLAAVLGFIAMSIAKPGEEFEKKIDAIVDLLGNAEKYLHTEQKKYSCKRLFKKERLLVAAMLIAMDYIDANKNAYLTALIIIIFEALYVANDNYELYI
ncbi:MAG: DUF4003 family protein [Lachnospiraceae bacterium]|nr:DUF4003 family protein [Lachnospiraceae bacterium]